MSSKSKKKKKSKSDSKEKIPVDIDDILARLLAVWPMLFLCIQSDAILGARGVVKCACVGVALLWFFVGFSRFGALLVLAGFSPE